MRTEVLTRWDDQDAQGHVNNASFGDYLQEARVALMHGSPIGDLLGSGVVVVSQQLEYLAPVLYDGTPIVADVVVGKVGASRFDFGYLLTHGGQPVLRATTTLCPVDGNGHPKRLTGAQAEWLRSEQGPMPQLRELPMQARTQADRSHHYAGTVRWSDLDRYDHVNNVSYLTYFQEARIAATIAVDPTGLRMGMDHLWLVARHDVAYLKPLAWQAGLLDIRTSIIKVGRTSLTLVSELFADRDATEPHARSITVLVMADLSGTPAEIGAEMREKVAGWVLA
ncbi:acyl-CoA thioesterase [Parenemella sanctibonifatiensis]|uniref:Uncharacterized protein n=1 Tax=Parenemella sanctibonifatiensis TaxID=2016505 RepID=A0A255E8B4_9ACTN|nr:thioesterase family protein [Parenemella sanctibonifatiensis]OYN87818.1 hypothetical protein CGZ92_06000 [Parenemella sanctibonifatiensis]